MAPDPSPDPSRRTARRDARRHLARLRALSRRLDHQAALLRNSGYDTRAEAQAGDLAADAFALRWALRRIAPALEGPGQLFAEMRHAGPPRDRDGL